MSAVRSVDIIGAGPAGLYTAILLRRLVPAARVRVFEQNPEGATFGFGVVFSDQALDFLKADDPETFDLVVPRMERWRNMTLVHPDGEVTLDGIGFAAVGRLVELIEILRARAEELGVELRFSHAVASLDELDAELIVGADGLNSLVRRALPDAFAPELDHFTNHFAWFGADRAFDTLTQTFVRTEKGALNAHHYRFAPIAAPSSSNATTPTFEAYGFASLSEGESAELCAEIFAETLAARGSSPTSPSGGASPSSGAGPGHPGGMSSWLMPRTPRIFSIGSGTRLAMEDAIALSSRAGPP